MVFGIEKNLPWVLHSKKRESEGVGEDDGYFLVKSESHLDWQELALPPLSLNLSKSLFTSLFFLLSLSDFSFSCLASSPPLWFFFPCLASASPTFSLWFFFPSCSLLFYSPVPLFFPSCSLLFCFSLPSSRAPPSPKPSSTSHVLWESGGEIVGVWGPCPPLLTFFIIILYFIFFFFFFYIYIYIFKVFFSFFLFFFVFFVFYFF